MPITEIVIPSLKQDEETRATFELTLQPFLIAALKKAPGIKQQVMGFIVSENGINVGSDFRKVLGVEWANADNFFDFLASDDFKAFGAQVKPFSLAPPNPQLFETDLGPSAVFASPLSEIFLIKIGEEGDAGQVWKVFTDAIKNVDAVDHSNGTHTSINFIFGTSLNQEEKKSIGAIAWGGIETRQDVLKNSVVSEARAALERLELYSFLVQFSQ